MEIKEQLTALKSEIEKGITQANAQAKNAGEVAAETKSALEKLTNEWAEKNNLSQEQVDGMATELKKIREGLSNRATIAKSFAERIAENEAYKGFLGSNGESRKNAPKTPLTMKAVGDMTSSGSLTNGSNVPFIEPTRLNSIIPVKREPFNVRSLFSVIPMTGNIFSFPQETGGEGAPTPVAEAGTKPQSDNDFEQKEAPARKIAHYKKLSEELLNDVPAMAGFLQTYGVVELLKVEDTQLLSGAGTGANLTGISVGALSDADIPATFLDKYALNGSNKFDALTAVIATLASNLHQADAIMLNPVDFYDMITDKASDGHYHYAQLHASGQPLQWQGVPIYLTTSVSAGTVFAGDSMAAQIAQREGISVRFYDQNEDDAINNMVTTVIEERLAFPIYYPGAWFSDTFANIKLALEAAS